MFCSKCGAHINNNISQCQNCGTVVVNNIYLSNDSELEKEKIKRILSLIFIILSACICSFCIFIYITVFLGVGFVGLFINLNFLDVLIATTKSFFNLSGIFIFILFFVSLITFIISSIIFFKSIKRIKEIKRLNFEKNRNTHLSSMANSGQINNIQISNTDDL